MLKPTVKVRLGDRIRIRWMQKAAAVVALATVTVWVAMASGHPSGGTRAAQRLSLGH